MTREDWENEWLDDPRSAFESLLGDFIQSRDTLNRAARALESADERDDLDITGRGLQKELKEIRALIYETLAMVY